MHANVFLVTGKVGRPFKFQAFCAQREGVQGFRWPAAQILSSPASLAFPRRLKVAGIVRFGEALFGRQ